MRGAVSSLSALDNTDIVVHLRPRVILIERYGQLVGLITVKDCLKYTLAHEAKEKEDADGFGAGDELEQTLDELKAWFQEMGVSLVDFVKGREPARRPVVYDDDEEEGAPLTDRSRR